MPEDNAFIWPAAGPTDGSTVGVVHVLPLPSGGCSVKIAFSDKGIVQAIGRGRIIKFRNIPTKRIARLFEFTIRHEGDFESSYSITDLTPHAATAGPSQRKPLNSPVIQGDELYEIVNGGHLNFQLSRAGKLVNPWDFIPAAPDRHRSPDDPLRSD